MGRVIRTLMLRLTGDTQFEGEAVRRIMCLGEECKEQSGGRQIPSTNIYSPKHTTLPTI